MVEELVLMSAVSKAVWMAAMTVRVTVVSKVDSWAVQLAVKKVRMTAATKVALMDAKTVDLHRHKRQ